MKFKWSSVKFVLLLNLFFLLVACNNVDDDPGGKPLAGQPPSNILATAQSSSVVVEWDSVADAISYTIYMASESGVNVEGLALDGVTQLNDFMIHRDVPNPFTHVNLVNSRTYYFRITAVNGAGKESVLSEEVTATPAVFPAPANVTAIVSDRKISIGWEPVSNAVTYNIYMASEAGVNKLGLAADGVTSLNNFMTHIEVPQPFLHANLFNGQAYWFRVSAVNSENIETSLSLEVKGTPEAIVAPQISSIVPADKSAQLMWNTVTTAVSYNVYMAQEPGVNKAGLASDGITALSGFMTHIGAASPFSHGNSLINGTRYYFVVTAVNGLGLESDISAEVDVTPALVVAAPTSLQADTISATDVSLRWIDNSTDELGFKIERAVVTNGSIVGTWVAIDQVGANIIVYQDTNVTPAIRYRYRVYAFTAIGNSVFSNEIEVDVPDVAPLAPSNVYIASVSDTQVDLAWTDNSYNETGFLVERAELIAGGDLGAWAEIGQTGVDVVTLSDSSVAILTRYQYRVSAFNLIGSSAVSELPTAIFVPPPLPAGPSVLAAAGVTSSSVRLTWVDNSADEVGFRLERANIVAGAISGTWGQIAEVGMNVTSYLDSNVIPAASYRYRVYAYNLGGNSSISNNLDVSTPNVSPAAPTALAAISITPTQVDFSWVDNSNNETGFRLERAIRTAGQLVWTWVDIMTTPANDTTASDTTVTELTNYRYRLTAFNAIGPSAFSNFFDVDISQSLPVAPSTLVIGISSSTLVPLSWQDNSNNEDGFEIERAEIVSGVVGPYTLAFQVGANNISANDTTMTPGKTYSYQVRAFNAGGYSPASLPFDVQVPPLDADTFLSFSNSSAARYQETAATALAYYAEIDPQNRRTTLTDWLFVNEFGSGGEADVPAIYLNDADLGFGRRMFVKERSDGGIGTYVENYATLNDAIAGGPPLLTVAMEYTKPEVDEFVERAREVVIAEAKWTLDPTNTMTTRPLAPGTYEIVVGRSNSDSTGTGPFVLNISFADGSPVSRTINGEWVSPWHSFSNATDYTDASNKRYTITTTTTETITITLTTDVDSRIWLLGTIGKVVAEDDNSGGGQNALITVVDLPVGDYTVITTGAQPYNVFSMVDILVSGNGPTSPVSVTQPVGMISMGINDPNSPVYRDMINFTVAEVQTVTISAVTQSGTIDPYLYLVSVNGTGQDVIRPRRIATTNYDFNINRVTLDLPLGSYTVVAGSGRIGVAQPFSLTINNDTLSTSIPVNGLQAWTSSGGPTPYAAGNPRFQFSVSPPTGQTHRVTITLSATPITNTDTSPELYVLGSIGAYRNIEAVNTGVDYAVTPKRVSEINTTLAAGTYTVVAATIRPAYTGDFTLEVTNNLNATSLLSAPGTWTNSAGYQHYAAANPRFTFTVAANNTPVTVLLKPTGDVDTMVYVLDSLGEPVIQASTWDMFDEFAVDAQLLTGQYVLVATPEGNSDKAGTFDIEWSIDGVVQPSFTGTWDHGEHANPYSPNNPRFPFALSANSRVVAKMRASTRASLYVLGLGDEKITTFYTYASDGTRVLTANLDGRGEKYQPGVCLVCHGGATKALVAGKYPDHGEIGSGFLAWDLDLFKYSKTNTQYSRANLEAKLKGFNKSALAVHRMPSTGSGEDKEPARNTMIKGWYGGPDMPNTVFNGLFVPRLWTPDSITGNANGIPDGADRLYLDVVKPTCRVCHVQRGGIMDALSNLPDMALAFGSYKAFMSYQKEIESTVYDMGTMPVAVRTHNKFWQTGQGDILTQHLPGFNRFEGDGITPLKPGRPIAHAGDSLLNGNRVVAPGTLVTLNGTQSSFASSYNWSLLAPAGSGAQLTGSTTAKPTFTANVAGDYVITLTVSNGVSNSVDSITINAASGYVPVSFSADLKPKYNPVRTRYFDGPLSHCMRCHIAREDNTGIDFGAYFDSFSHQDSAYSMVFGGVNAYANIRNRVNLDAPMHSLMLQKPSNEIKHSGGLEPGFGPTDVEQYYDLVLRWILEGAKNN